MADEDIEEIVPEKEEEKKKGTMKKPDYGKLSFKAPVEIIETGILPLDVVMGGGYERGDMIQISSPSGIGKSTMMVHATQKFYMKGEKVAYLDVEKGVKQRMLERFPVGGGKTLWDVADDKPGAQFLFLKPTTFADLDSIVYDLLQGFKYDHIIIDSITSLTTAKAQDKGVEDDTIGVKSRVTCNLLDKYKGPCRINNINWWHVNQARIKGRGKGKFMTFELGAAGGNAQEHYPDIRLMMAEGPQMVKVTETITGTQKLKYGNFAWIWADKNRTDNPYVKVECPIIFGVGVSNVVFIKGLMQTNGVLTGGSGGHYKVNLGGEEIGIYGTDKINPWIKEHFLEIKTYMKQAGMLDLIKNNEPS